MTAHDFGGADAQNLSDFFQIFTFIAHRNFYQNIRAFHAARKVAAGNLIDQGGSQYFVRLKLNQNRARSGHQFAHASNRLSLQRMQQRQGLLQVGQLDHDGLMIDG